jgi:tetratricopeptide (TPR) repeat protein
MEDVYYSTEVSEFLIDEINVYYTEVSELIDEINSSGKKSCITRAQYILSKATAEYPYVVAFIGQEALLFEAIENFAAARTCYERAHALDASSSTRLRNHALLLEEHFADYRGAEALYKEALVLEPSNVNLLGELGDLYETMQDHNSAKKCYKKGLSLDPQDPLCRNNFLRIGYGQAVKKKDIGALEDAMAAMSEIMTTESRTKANEHTMTNMHSYNNGDLYALNLQRMQKARDAIKRGEEIYRCSVCNTPGTKRCSKCYGIVYCSRECQAADWKVHKKKCGKNVLM